MINLNRAAIHSPTMIYLPWLSSISDEILIKPEPEKLEPEQIKNTDAGWLIILLTGKGGIRTASIQFAMHGKENYQIRNK